RSLALSTPCSRRFSSLAAPPIASALLLRSVYSSNNSSYDISRSSGLKHMAHGMVGIQLFFDKLGTDISCDEIVVLQQALVKLFGRFYAVNIQLTEGTQHSCDRLFT